MSNGNVRIYKLPDEPIIIAELGETFTVDSARQIFTETQRIRETISGHVYRITDATGTQASFAEVLSAVKAATADSASSTVDPTVTVVFVGRTHWSKLFVDAMRQQQFGKVTIPIFNTQAEALDYIREKIARDSELNSQS